MIDPFLQRALLEVVLVGVLAGAVGVHVVLRRLPFFTMAMTHATFPGVVLAALLGVDLLLGSAGFGLLLVLLLAALGRRGGVDDTSTVGVLLAGGFGLGVLLLSAQDGFSRDLAAFTVGSVLTVSPTDLVLTAVAAVLVLGVLAALGKELVLVGFDRTAAEAAGYRVRVLDLVLLVLVEVTVVAVVPAVGVILAVSLLVAPAAAARQWCSRLLTTTVLSVVLAVASGVAGVLLSRWYDVAAGGAVVLVATAVFVVSVVAAPRLVPAR